MVPDPSWSVLTIGRTTEDTLTRQARSSRTGCAHGSYNNVDIGQLFMDLRSGPADMGFPVLFAELLDSHHTHQER